MCVQIERQTHAVLGARVSRHPQFATGTVQRINQPCRHIGSKLERPLTLRIIGTGGHVECVIMPSVHDRRQSTAETVARTRLPL
jgi:hypothetical protein